MNDIGRVDQAVLQLRARLQRLARERTQRSNPASRPEARPLERFRRIESANSLNDEEFRRKFVRALLTEDLGEALGNQPEFERIANEVWRLLDEDPDTRAMLDEAVRSL